MARFVRHGKYATYTHDNICPATKKYPCMFTVEYDILGTEWCLEEYGCDGCGGRIDADCIIAADPDRTREELEEMGITLPDARKGPGQIFGGEWTLEKLEMLENYLNAYTTVMKKQPFKLVYIDAFAGTGELRFRRDQVTEYMDGSVERALRVGNRPFDELIFIEKNQDKYTRLKQRLDDCSRCNVERSDCNDFIRTVDMDWRLTRGVVFLDPFGADVNWSTIERIAGFNALDMWLLYPTTAINRLLPRKKLPSDAMDGWDKKLTTVFGGNEWEALYEEDPQQTLTGELHYLRDNAEEISMLYRSKLKGLFGRRFLDKTYQFKTGNRVLFEFMFCVGNTRGISIAKRLAEHILTTSGNGPRTDTGG